MESLSGENIEISFRVNTFIFINKIHYTKVKSKEIANNIIHSIFKRCTRKDLAEILHLTGMKTNLLILNFNSF